MSEIIRQIIDTASSLDVWGILGLLFGLLAVWFLIIENIWTWPSGIAYVLVSLVVFWEARLFGDFLLHILYFILNSYGWYYWLYGKNKQQEVLPVTKSSSKEMALTVLLTAIGVYVFGYFLQNLPDYIEGLPAAALPYWDSATSVLSITGMWLTAKKRIDSWYYWLVVDILATGIYFYKEIYFYAVLYMVYIVMAVLGYLAWKKSLSTQQQVPL
ncbi:nicotinamide riboside transporter PnuC [Fulvivirgaceae bacterium BMA12]|uniref:Nicotinamide riboside transporter PnuC n=1 Tax=Agaribacillus aureus TaxID=3051825 RepID=A0ABT8LCY2_9BACT|nr:nicotinamide riboside transporter PnuC [Fulvivirgaceae bacterium BMA12]